VATRADISLNPATGKTPEQARDARARAWAYVFRCHESKNPAAGPSVRGDNDGTRAEEDSADESILPDWT
jgi:hypothetical protein